MRGFQRPALHNQTSDAQRAFRALSRHRRARLARIANTTLLKADQWSRGGDVGADVGHALEVGLNALRAHGVEAKKA
jgi:hypothetical protein